jgi:hypothetical protein
LDHRGLSRDFYKERVPLKMVTWKISEEFPLFLQRISPMFKEMYYLKILEGISGQAA